MITNYTFSNSSFTKLSALFSGDTSTIRKNVEPCTYEWDDKTADIWEKCVKNYTYYNEEANPISKLIFHIKEAVLGLFNCSDWNNASNRLAGFMTLAVALDSGTNRGEGAIRYFAYKNEFKSFADNILRMKLGYDFKPKVIYSMDLPSQIYDTLTKTHEYIRVDFECDDADSRGFTFTKKYGYPQKDYLFKK